MLLHDGLTWVHSHKKSLGCILLRVYYVTPPCKCLNKGEGVIYFKSKYIYLELKTSLCKCQHISLVLLNKSWLCGERVTL